MITLICLAIALVAIALIAAFLIGTGGIAVLLVFGDVIVAGLVVYGIVRAIVRRR